MFLDENWILFPDVASNENDKDHGWICIPNEEKGIIWVPPMYRKNLWRPQNSIIISPDGYTKISLKDCVYGEKWAECYDG